MTILNFSIQIEVEDSGGEKWAGYHKYQLQNHFRHIEQWGTGKLKSIMFIPILDNKVLEEQEYFAWTHGEMDL